ncbi:hypothetical protein [Vibrio sp. CyArs1]|uniref:hypothetical protein n=1 Tax=Vibrio sp. CyArs1 TaxID=2682577 RepID=UPI001F064BE7|nr:hypothetical protein [Vibrio sp. CyArs1]
MTDKNKNYEGFSIDKGEMAKTLSAISNHWKGDLPCCLKDADECDCAYIISLEKFLEVVRVVGMKMTKDSLKLTPEEHLEKIKKDYPDSSTETWVSSIIESLGRDESFAYSDLWEDNGNPELEAKLEIIQKQMRHWMAIEDLIKYQ